MAEEASVCEPGSQENTKLCQTCRRDVARYRCPACDMRTCNLLCTKQHREDQGGDTRTYEFASEACKEISEHIGCTGKRSRTSLVKVCDFTEKQLMADIRLMDEIERDFDSARRREPQRLPCRLPQRLQELHREAVTRGVNLEFLGPGMQRRLQNSTYHDRRARKMLWHIEWQFAAANLHIHERRVNDAALVGEILEKHVRHQKRGFKDDEKMAPYTSAGTQGLVVLMRQARAQINKFKYYTIDIQKSLASQLSGKHILEFPVFLVLLPDEAKDYPLVGQESTTEATDSSSASDENSSLEESSAGDQ